MSMRIHIKVTVGYHGSRRCAEKEAEIRSEGNLPDLPWEDICAGLVQSAIKGYEKAVAEAENEGE